MEVVSDPRSFVSTFDFSVLNLVFVLFGCKLITDHILKVLKLVSVLDTWVLFQGMAVVPRFDRCASTI